MGKRFFFPLFIASVMIVLLASLVNWAAWLVSLILVLLLILSFVFRRLRVFLCAATVLSLLLTVSVSLQTRSYTETVYQATVTGRVSAIYRSHDEQALVLENVSIIKNGRSFDCQNVEVVLENTSVMRAGYVLKMEGTVYGNSREADHPGERSSQFSALANRRSHTVRDCSQVEILFYEERPDSVFDALRRFIKSKIVSVGESEDVHAVLYAMITGDRGPVSAETYELFSDTGTAHLLAVSGLHISVLLGAILFLLRRLPVRPVYYLVPLCALIVFYCLLTGLSASVLRASLMAMLMLCAMSFGTRYDPLNALSLAGILILLVNPFRVFDCAFQLSFSAYFGIAAYHRFRRFSALSVTLSATLASLPVSLYAFRRMAPLSVLANLLFVPVASMALLLLFAGLVLSALFPALTVVLIVPYRMMYLVLFLASSARSLTPPILVAPFPAWMTAVSLGALIFYSRFVHVRRFAKNALAAILIVSVLVCAIGSAFQEENTVTVCALANGSNTPAVHVSCGKDVMIHSPAGSAYTIKQYTANNLSAVDALFVLTQAEADALPYVWEDGDVKCIYFLPGLSPPDHLPAPARILNEPVGIGRATFAPASGGLYVCYRDQTVFIEGTGKTDRPVAAAIGRAGNDCRILISRSEDDPAAEAVYPTAFYGCVYIIWGRRLDVRPFHEVRFYESY